MLSVGWDAALTGRRRDILNRVGRHQPISKITLEPRAATRVAVWDSETGEFNMWSKPKSTGFVEHEKFMDEGPENENSGDMWVRYLESGTAAPVVKAVVEGEKAQTTFESLQTLHTWVP